MSVAAFHHVLLRIAGWVPDDLVATARDLLARGAVEEVAAIVGYARATTRAPLSEFDLALLPASGGPPTDTGTAHHPLPPVSFSATEPTLRDGPGSTVDPSGAAPTGPEANPPVDLGPLAAACASAIELESEGTARGLWQVWRTPDRATGYPPPKQMFLVLAVAKGELLALTAARLQEVLSHAGEPAPQVEVFAAPLLLPPYQRAALASSTLIWADDPTGVLARTQPAALTRPRVARLLDPDGPPGKAGQVLAERERERVLSFLTGGSPIVSTTATMDDVLDGTPAVVPMGYRSDGVWVWPDGLAHYLRSHSMAPEADLLAHIRASGYRADPVAPVVTHQAMDALATASPDAAW
ncbi:hypothetical protein C1I95_20805 [Micromonospora craterilacus]|uniref:SseB protein N-terminal domain-containing protein n=1 Tax=Micromonospora craterilacus TaxID=1655439 RepID=A0A2W2ECX1_9ACTN|nr:hypothetical protein [Micromonospora craterilacus]PZG14875.1 hypothetical protein C1I95_20805 [Micromonospora craterilacus]